MKSTQLKAVISFPSTQEFEQGLNLIKSKVEFEFSGHPQALNFYTEEAYLAAFHIMTGEGMVFNRNFRVHT